MKPILITITASGIEPVPSPQVISDLLHSLLKGLHIHVETVTVCDASAPVCYPLPRKRGTKTTILS